jgi:hypothetical protein
MVARIGTIEVIVVVVARGVVRTVVIVIVVVRVTVELTASMAVKRGGGEVKKTRKINWKRLSSPTWIWSFERQARTDCRIS